MNQYSGKIKQLGTSQAANPLGLAASDPAEKEGMSLLGSVGLGCPRTSEEEVVGSTMSPKGLPLAALISTLASGASACVFTGKREIWCVGTKRNLEPPALVHQSPALLPPACLSAPDTIWTVSAPEAPREPRFSFSPPSPVPKSAARWALMDVGHSFSPTDDAIGPKDFLQHTEGRFGNDETRALNGYGGMRRNSLCLLRESLQQLPSFHGPDCATWFTEHPDCRAV
ncbi:uncharacterized protein [Narcine bancroftii]|uniref:uncharacterized protein n=1 Tax=Narcine bancroftii TaxID=1343680 RepID=UPI00383142BF